VQREDLARWIGEYERAWRTPGTGPLDQLFTSNAEYLASPFEPPIQGRSAIASFWEAERDGPDELFSMDWEPVAVENDVGVAKVEVRYGDPPTRVYRDLWIVTLDEARLCSRFEEWPFFPGQPRAAPEAAWSPATSDQPSESASASGERPSAHKGEASRPCASAAGRDAPALRTGSD
jgi:hypothetical protein